MKQLFLTFITMSATISASAQNQAATQQTISPNPIKVNQVGYYSQDDKIATIEPTAKSKTFTIKDKTGKTVWKGKATATKKSPFANVTRQEINFSKLTTPGTYTLMAGTYQQPPTWTRWSRFIHRQLRQEELLVPSSHRLRDGMTLATTTSISSTHPFPSA